jgi:hypothetical protein
LPRPRACRWLKEAGSAFSQGGTYSGCLSWRWVGEPRRVRPPKGGLPFLAGAYSCPAPARDNFVDLRPLDGARFLAREEAASSQGSALWKSGRSPHSGKGCALPPTGTTQPQRFAAPARGSTPGPSRDRRFYYSQGEAPLFPAKNAHALRQRYRQAPMPLPYLRDCAALRVAGIGPAGRARGERKNILEFFAVAYL